MKWGAIAGAVLIGLFVTLVIIGLAVGDDEASTSNPSVAAGDEPSDDATQDNSSTDLVPSTTPAPPRPTAIPPTPTPAPQPVSLAGVGQLVTDPFIPPSRLSKVTFSHSGFSNFIVTAYSDDGNELLVNEIGDYAGSRPLIGEGPWFLEIDADGSWTAIVEALTFDPAAAGGVTGSGSQVSGLFEPSSGGATPFEISNTGTSNFIVMLHCAGGSDLVQNEIGPVQGSTVVSFDDGPCFWEVESDGTWSVIRR